MPGQGIRQADIPKMKKFLAAGESPEKIAKGMLGYHIPVHTIESFVGKKKTMSSGANIKPSTHPQDVAAAKRRKDKEKED